MRQRHHIPRLAVVIHQQIGMRRRHGGVRKRPRCLAGAESRINPRLVKELPTNLSQARAEGTIGIQYLRNRLGPGDQAVILIGQRRIAIPMLQFFQPKPFRLHGVIAMRKPREAGAHSGNQSLHHLIFHHIGAVARGSGARVAPPLVNNLLVFRQGIRDQREQPALFSEGRRDTLGGRFTHRAIPIRKPVQRVRHGQAFRATRQRHVHLHGGDGFIKQPVPGGSARHFLLVQQLFRLIRKLMRAKHAKVAQPGAEAGQRGGIGAFAIQHRIFQPVQFQREEDQMAADRGRAFLHGLIEAPIRRVFRIAAEDQLGIGHDAAQDFLNRLILGNRRRQVIA